MKQILPFLLAALLVLSACSSGKTTGTSDKDPFIGGTTGLTLAFEEDAPPAEVFDAGQYPFSAVVKLKNEGEFAVPKEKVTVTLSGILAREFGKTEVQLSQRPADNLEPMRKEADGGIVDSNPVFVSFDDLEYQTALTGNTEFTLRADVCYTYGTTAVSKLCVRKNNLDTDEGVCTVNEAKSVFSSGAPIQVTDFKESARSRDKISFTFMVQKAGTGDLFQQTSACGNDRRFEDKVWVEVTTGIDGLECTGLSEGTMSTGYMTLYGDSKPITCTQTVTTSSDYEKEVKVKLVYDYEETQSTTLLVKRSNS
ncbi:MAG: hypothetical protein Q7S65_04320 [Nanoarchaeota archaeon]|nr:hypothetical protein [Nanoarchaeota archaeon]